MASLTEWNEFEQTAGDSEGQRSLACCSPRGRKESDKTEQLNNNNNKEIHLKVSRETGVPRRQKNRSGAYCRRHLASREPSAVFCFQHVPTLLWGLAHSQRQTHGLGGGGGGTVMRLQPLTGGIMLPKQDQSGSVSEIFWLELEKDPVPGAMGQKRVEVEEEGGLILSHTEKACLL